MTQIVNTVTINAPVSRPVAKAVQLLAKRQAKDLRSLAKLTGRKREDREALASEWDILAAACTQALSEPLSDTQEKGGET